MSRFDRAFSRNVARVTAVFTAIAILAILRLLWVFLKLLFQAFKSFTTWYVEQFEFRPFLSRCLSFIALIILYGMIASLTWDVVDWRIHYLPPDKPVSIEKNVWFISTETALIYNYPTNKEKEAFTLPAGTKLNTDSSFQDPQWLRFTLYADYYVKRSMCHLKRIPVTLYQPNGKIRLPMWLVCLLSSLPFLFSAILIRSKEEMVDVRFQTYKSIDEGSLKFLHSDKLNPKLKIEIS
jgi:hypothetical protein